MKKKIILMLIVIVIVFCYIIGKVNEKNMNLNINGQLQNSNSKIEKNYNLSDAEENINNLINTIYSNDELEKILEQTYTLESLKSFYPIECFREYYGGYKAVYSSEDKFLVIIFDNLGNKEFSCIYLKSANSEFLDRIDENTSYDDVMKLDKNGNYLATSSLPYHTTHYTEDGYFVSIEYDNDLYVKKIYVELL